MDGLVEPKADDLGIRAALRTGTLLVGGYVGAVTLVAVALLPRPLVTVGRYGSFAVLAGSTVFCARSAGPSPYPDLALRGRALWTEGARTGRAAARLFVTEATIKTRLLNNYGELGVNDQAGGIAEGCHRGPLTPRSAH